MPTSNPLSTLLKNRSVQALILSALGLVAASWYRVLIAGTVMVDGHGLTGLPEIIVFFLFLASLAGFSISYYRLWKSDALNTTSLKFLAFLLTILFSFMLPMLSNDIFTYLTFGGASNAGIDVYTNPQGIHVSPYFSYLGPQWINSPCAYGPVALMVDKLAAWAGSGNIVQALLAYKLLNILFAFVFIEMAIRIGNLLNVGARNTLFILLNPIFLLQGAGQAHCEFMAITFALCSIYFTFTNRWYLAFIGIALCVATKMTYVLMAPFIVVVLFINMKKLSSFVGQMALGLIIAAITCMLAYYPFYVSPATLTFPFNYHLNQNPSKCIAEILGDIIYFAPKLFGGNKDELTNTVNSLAWRPDQQVMISYTILKICRAIALLACAYIFVKFWFSNRGIKQWFRVYTRFILLFLLYYLHLFHPWHLMMALPFIWMDDDERYMQWLFVLTCLVNVQDIVCSISRDSVVYYIELVLTFLSVMAYMWRFRRVFIKSLGY